MDAANTNRNKGTDMADRFDRDARRANFKLQQHHLAMEILRQSSGPDIMTMAEAMRQAKRELAQGR